MLPISRFAVGSRLTGILAVALAVCTVGVSAALAGGNDQARGVVVDFEQNIIVWGFSKESGAGKWDFFTRKYAPDGSTIWSKRFHDVSPNEYAGERLLGVDEKGTVYIGGAEDVINSHRPIIVRYSSSGEQRSLVQFSYFGTLRALRVKNSSTTYAAGEVLQQNYTTWDFLTVKKRFSLMAPSWQRTHDTGLMDNMPDVTSSVDGSVYIAGWTKNNNAGTSKIKIVKYTSTGTKSWVRTFSAGDWNYPAANGAVVTDAGGNLYVCGAGGDNGVSEDIALVKYSPAGVRLWTRLYDGGGVSEWGQSVKVDGNGNVIVAGAIAPGATWAFATLKYDPDGNLLWAKVYDDYCNDVPESLKVDNDGFVYVTGYSKSATTGTGRDFLTIKYTPQGTVAWSRLLDGGLGMRDRPRSLAVDAAGNVYVTGETWKDDAGNDRDYLTAKYSRDGVLLWTRTYDSQ